MVEFEQGLATTVVPDGYAGKYQIQFGEFGRGRGKYGHHRDTVMNPEVIAEVDDLDVNMPPNEMNFENVESLVFPRDNLEEYR